MSRTRSTSGGFGLRAGRLARLAAFLAGSTLLGVLWFAAAAGESDRAAMQATDGLRIAAGAIAQTLDATLGRFDALASGFRAPDLIQPDRLALTARLLRVQSAFADAGAVFATNAAGRVLGASQPLPSGASEVGDADWFQAAMKADGRGMSLARVDASWLRLGPTLILSKPVRDPSGQPAGLVGAILGIGDVTSVLGPNWLASGVAVRLVAADGSVLGRSTASDDPGSRAAGVTGVGERLFLAIARLADGSPRLDATAALTSAPVNVVASLGRNAAMMAAWPGIWQRLAALAVGLGAVWLAFVAVMLLGGRRRAGPAAPEIGYGVDWSFTLDHTGRLTGVAGYTPDLIREGIGRKLTELVIAAPQGGEERSALQLALASHQALDQEIVRLDAAVDAERVQRLSIRPVAGGGFVGTAWCVGGEVLAVERAQAARAALADAERRLADTVRERDRALAAVGHDVRTPMNSILGICSLLLDGHLEDDQRRWIERIASSCETLLAMLNGLLEIASSDAGGNELQLYDTDVGELVTEVADLLSPQAHDKGLVLACRTDDLLGGLWQVDPTRLRQVVFNLVSNAIKYTGSGRVDLRAAVISDADGGSAIRITVADTGPGIAPSDRVRIFERFKRGGEESERGDGLGLGLALCRENAALMGGTLTVESTLGVGSEFTFEFIAERAKSAPRLLPFSGRTALVVGLEPSAREALCQHLARLGFATEHAADGYLGLGVAERTAAHRGVLDLVVLDADLHGMPAKAFCLRLRATSFGSHTALITVTKELERHGSDGGDATVVASAGPGAIAAAAAKLLGELPALAALAPDIARPSGGRVLVVEDNEVNRSLLSVGLSRRGFTAFVAGSGEEAVRLAARDGFDAILMDIQMPGIDGFEAMRRIRDLGGRAATVPVVALTALSGSVIRKRCLDAGATAMIEKPVHIERLCRSLREWIAEAARSACEVPSPLSAAMIGDAGAGAADRDMLVSQAFLACVVDDVGLERTKACVEEFLQDVATQCLRLAELLPGWEADLLRRTCRDVRSLADTLGAIGLSEALEDLLDAVDRGSHEDAEGTMQRIKAMVSPLTVAMWSSLAEIERRRSNRRSEAA